MNAPSEDFNEWCIISLVKWLLYFNLAWLGFWIKECSIHVYSLLVSLNCLKNEVEHLLKYVNLDYCGTAVAAF